MSWFLCGFSFWSTTVQMSSVTNHSFMTVQTCRYLWLVLRISAVTMSLWSHDHYMGIWSPVCKHDNAASYGHVCHLQLYQFLTNKVNRKAGRRPNGDHVTCSLNDSIYLIVATGSVVIALSKHQSDMTSCFMTVVVSDGNSGPNCCC